MPLGLPIRLILVLALAAVVALVVRRRYLHYTVALVAAGVLLDAIHLFPVPHLSQELLYSVFLPGLLFEAAFHLEFRQFWRNRMAIGALAVPGVIASTLLIAVLLVPIAQGLHILPGFSWREGLVFGALISATDPVAVVSLFRSVRGPRRLLMLLDSESLLNDGTSIVFFTLALSLATGGVVNVGSLLVEFLTIVGMGALTGAVIGTLTAMAMRSFRAPILAIAFTAIGAYGSFVCAEQLHYSGVIATVTAGMLCGNLGCKDGVSTSTCASVNTFWESIALALNSIVFLLIGVSVRLPLLSSDWLPILLAYLVVTASRAAVVGASCALLWSTRERFPWSWAAVLTWGGLRGALPMVLALSLPDAFPYRDVLVAMTFGVAVLSILLQGTSMSPLMRHLGLAGPSNPSVPGGHASDA